MDEVKLTLRCVIIIIIIISHALFSLFCTTPYNRGNSINADNNPPTISRMYILALISPCRISCFEVQESLMQLRSK